MHALKNGFQLEGVRQSGGQRDVLSAPGAAGASRGRFIVRWAVSARLGNREKSRGAGSELLAGGCCFEQDVPRVSAQGEIERWRTGRARSRENAAGWTRAIVCARKHVRTSETLHSENTHAVSSLFLPLRALCE